MSSHSKLFTFILNNRLSDYATKKGILKDEQGGFRKMHGIVDSIFILIMLIDKYVKSKSQRQRSMLFSCFVDFSKAFDRVKYVCMYVCITGQNNGFTLNLHSAKML